MIAAGDSENLLKWKGKLELPPFVYAAKPKRLWLVEITVLKFFYSFPKALYNKVNWYCFGGWNNAGTYLQQVLKTKIGFKVTKKLSNQPCRYCKKNL